MAGRSMADTLSARIEVPARLAARLHVSKEKDMYIGGGLLVLILIILLLVILF